MHFGSVNEGLYIEDTVGNESADDLLITIKEGKGHPFEFTSSGENPYKKTVDVGDVIQIGFRYPTGAEMKLGLKRVSPDGPSFVYPTLDDNEPASFKIVNHTSDEYKIISAESDTEIGTVNASINDLPKHPYLAKRPDNTNGDFKSYTVTFGKAHVITVPVRDTDRGLLIPESGKYFMHFGSVNKGLYIDDPTGNKSPDNLLITIREGKGHPFQFIRTGVNLHRETVGVGHVIQIGFRYPTGEQMKWGLKRVSPDGPSFVYPTLDDDEPAYFKIINHMFDEYKIFSTDPDTEIVTVNVSINGQPKGPYLAKRPNNTNEDFKSYTVTFENTYT